MGDAIAKLPSGLVTAVSHHDPITGAPDGVKVTVFKQAGGKGSWRDRPVDNAVARSLEDTILTRARQLKVAQTTK